MAGKKLIPLTPDDLKLNQLVEIVVDEEGYKGTYPSRIEEINNTTLALAMPTRRGQIISLRPDSQIGVGFSKEGNGYLFETTILKLVRTPLPVLIVKKPVEAERRQRRSWVRVEINIPIKFRLYTLGSSLQLDNNDAAGFQEAISVDISGGGMMFTTNEELREGDLLALILEFPDSSPLHVMSRIARIRHTPPTAKMKYFVGTEFLGLRKTDQDRIVGIVFDRQRKLIKKRLL